MPHHRPEHPVPRDAQHRGGIPGRIRDEVMHRLMARRDVARIDARRHRLDALALPGQAQPGDVRAQWPMTIPMTEGAGELLHIRLKPLGSSGCGVGHASMLTAYPMPVLIFLTQ